MTSQNDDDIAALAEAARQLVQKVDGINVKTGDTIVGLGTATKNNRRMILIVAVSVILDLLLTGLVFFGLSGVNDNSQRLSQVTERLDLAQTEGRQKSLCPLYTLLLGAKSDKARAVNPDGPAAYDKAFKVIEEGFNGLHCQDFVGKGPTLGP